jgi:hypothetical protein
MGGGGGGGSLCQLTGIIRSVAAIEQIEFDHVLACLSRFLATVLGTSSITPRS